MDDQKLELRLALETVKMFRDLINKQEKLNARQQEILDYTFMRSMTIVENVLISVATGVIKKLNHECECKEHVFISENK